jgi:dihydroneopterin aldolase
MDRITLRGVRAYGRHGAYPGERDAEQAFDVEAVVDIDLRAAERSDDLADTLNYTELYERVVTIVQSTSWLLLERLAGEIVASIFRDARVSRAEVSVSKPGILDGAPAAVTLIRDNPHYRATSS